VNASAVVRAASARAFDGWCAAVADRLVREGWGADAAGQTAQAVIALIEGALILSRIAGNRSALDAAKAAARTLLSSRP
jgi:TetR/AcrR family transcriptional repressor of lmrAB and yxaGH operons